MLSTELGISRASGAVLMPKAWPPSNVDCVKNRPGDHLYAIRKVMDWEEGEVSTTSPADLPEYNDRALPLTKQITVRINAPTERQGASAGFEHRPG